MNVIYFNLLPLKVTPATLNLFIYFLKRKDFIELVLNQEYCFKKIQSHAQ